MKDAVESGYIAGPASEAEAQSVRPETLPAMVNYKRVVCEVAVLAALVAVAAAAPAHDCNERHYDQRQNGSENYRLNIDGVVIAVAPAESFMSAVSEIDLGDLLEEFNEVQKPKPPPENPPSKPDATKPEDSKPEAPEKPEAPAKPDAPLSDVSLNPETKGQKKDAGHAGHAGRKPVKGQRLKTLLANMLVPLLRRHQK